MARVLSIAIVSLLLGLAPVQTAGATWMGPAQVRTAAATSIFGGETRAASAGMLPAEHGVVSEAPVPRLPAGADVALAFEQPRSGGIDRALGVSAICRESDPVLDSALNDTFPLGSEPPPQPGPYPSFGDLRLP